MSWSGQSRIANAISLIPSPTSTASATSRAARSQQPRRRRQWQGGQRGRRRHRSSVHDGRVSTRQVRLAKTVVAGLVIGLGVANLWFSVTGWTLSDASAYWEAAHRLREGGELYPAVANVEASNVYRYAPWFAWLAMPFTYLPVQIAGALWSLVLVAASTAAVIPMARRGALLQVAFFFPILIGISAVGNAQALMVAWLVWGVERRSGPVWVALAASLKAVPLLLALVYLGRREWLRAVLSVALHRAPRGARIPV